MVDAPATTWGPCTPYLDAASAAALGCVCVDFDINDEANEAVYEAALGWASRRVFMATNYFFSGVCTAKIRPCRPQPMIPGLWPGGSGYPIAPGLPGWLPTELADQYPAALPVFAGFDLGGGPLFVNCWACTCGLDACSCGFASVVALPWVPVRDVTEVKVDGVVLDPAVYRLRPNTNLLARVDGTRWPWLCQNQDEDDSHVGTWSVTFRHGIDLPPEALPLVGMYACELAKACKGQPCGLAPGVRIVSRPGVAYDDVVYDPAWREKGLVGFGPLDDWIVELRGGHTTITPRIYRPGRDWPSGYQELPSP